MEQLNEYNNRLKEIRKDLQENGMKTFKRSLSELFSKHSDLNAVSMVFYRPYFSDGDACLYSLNQFQYQLKSALESSSEESLEENDEDEDEENDEDEDEENDEEEEDYEENFQEMYCLSDMPNELETDLYNFYDIVGNLAEFLEDVIEDSRITVYFDGTMKQREYNHD